MLVVAAVLSVCLSVVTAELSTYTRPPITLPVSYGVVQSDVHTCGDSVVAVLAHPDDTDETPSLFLYDRDKNTGAITFHSSVNTQCPRFADDSLLYHMPVSFTDECDVLAFGCIAHNDGDGIVKVYRKDNNIWTASSVDVSGYDSQFLELGRSVDVKRIGSQIHLIVGGDGYGSKDRFGQFKETGMAELFRSDDNGVTFQHRTALHPFNLLSDEYVQNDERNTAKCGLNVALFGNLIVMPCRQAVHPTDSTLGAGRVYTSTLDDPTSFRMYSSPYPGDTQFGTRATVMGTRMYVSSVNNVIAYSTEYNVLTEESVTDAITPANFWNGPIFDGEEYLAFSTTDQSLVISSVDTGGEVGRFNAPFWTYSTGHRTGFVGGDFYYGENGVIKHVNVAIPANTPPTSSPIAPVRYNLLNTIVNTTGVSTMSADGSCIATYINQTTVVVYDSNTGVARGQELETFTVSDTILVNDDCTVLVLADRGSTQYYSYTGSSWVLHADTPGLISAIKAGVALNGAGDVLCGVNSGVVCFDITPTTVTVKGSVISEKVTSLTFGWGLAISPAGTTLVVTDMLARMIHVYIFLAGGWAEVGSGGTTIEDILSVTIDPLGVMVAVSTETSVKLFVVNSGTNAVDTHAVLNASPTTTSVTVNTAANKIAIGGWTTAYVYEWAQGEYVLYSVHEGVGDNVKLSSDGTKLMASSADVGIQFLENPGGTKAPTSAPTRLPSSAPTTAPPTLSPVASASDWIPDGTVLNATSVVSVDITPDGSQFGFVNGKLNTFTSGTNVPVNVGVSHNGLTSFSSFAMSGDGSTLVGGTSGSVLLADGTNKHFVTGVSSGSKLGQSVAINQDGTIVAVGMPGLGSGSVRMFTSMVEGTALSGPVGVESFGSYVSLSDDGTTVSVVGKYTSNGMYHVFVYDIVNGTWVMRTDLTTNGHSKAVLSGNGECVLVDDHTVPNAYVYKYNSGGNTWDYAFGVIPRVGMEGNTLSISSTCRTIAVGTPGGIHTFDYNGAWVEINHPFAGAGLLAALSAYGNKIVIGDPTSETVQVFTRPTTTGVPTVSPSSSPTHSPVTMAPTNAPTGVIPTATSSYKTVNLGTGFMPDGVMCSLFSLRTIQRSGFATETQIDNKYFHYQIDYDGERNYVTSTPNSINSWTEGTTHAGTNNANAIYSGAQVTTSDMCKGLCDTVDHCVGVVWEHSGVCQLMGHCRVSNTGRSTVDTFMRKSFPGGFIADEVTIGQKCMTGEIEPGSHLGLILPPTPQNCYDYCKPKGATHFYMDRNMNCVCHTGGCAVKEKDVWATTYALRSADIVSTSTPTTQPTVQGGTYTPTTMPTTKQPTGRPTLEPDGGEVSQSIPTMEPTALTMTPTSSPVASITSTSVSTSTSESSSSVDTVVIVLATIGGLITLSLGYVAVYGTPGSLQ